MLRVNLPPLTKAALALSVLLSAIVAMLRYSAYFALAADNNTIDFSAVFVSYLTVVPAQSIVFPWAFVTAAFVERNLVSLFVALATLFYAARYCERVWGSKELAKFLLILAIVPNLLTFALYLLAFAVTANTDYQFVTICGGVALQAGFLVAFKQLVPEHTVVLFRGVIKIRVKHFPALFLLANSVLGVCGARTTALLAWSGFFTAWTYLRFYRVTVVSPEFGSAMLPLPASAPGSTPTTTRGDASDTFSMANFFPDAVAPLVSAVSDKLFAALVSIHICTPFSQEDIDASNLRNGQFRQRFVAPLPGSVRAEAERRRALALKALDQRLSQGKKDAGSLGETNFVPEDNQS